MEIKVNVTIEGLKDLTDVLHEMARAMVIERSREALDMHATEQADPGTAESTVPTQASPAPQIPVAPPTPEPQTSVPVQPPIAPAAQQSVVPTAPAEEYSLEQISVAMTGLMEQIGMQGVQAIMAQFGVQTLMQIPKEAYPQLVTIIREKGGRI